MNLKPCSDSLLLKQMSSLVREERALLSKVLWHLREIDTRKLYSDLKYGSLFDYCVKELRYSEGQAARRVAACRLLKELPEIMPKIEQGSLNLTQLAQAGAMFAQEKLTSSTEKLALLDEIAGKATRETEKILDKKRKIEKPRRRSLILKEETIEIIQEVQNLKAHKFKDIDEALLEMAKLAKREWDPEVIKRRTKVTETDSRYIPKQVKAAVWARDKGQCQNCTSRRALEYDHIKPFGLGGKTNMENLRLLCRNCNQRKGLKDFPKAVIISSQNTRRVL